MLSNVCVHEPGCLCGGRSLRPRACASTDYAMQGAVGVITFTSLKRAIGRLIVDTRGWRLLNINENHTGVDK